jgi:hypothetical protein
VAYIWSRVGLGALTVGILLAGVWALVYMRTDRIAVPLLTTIGVVAAAVLGWGIAIVQTVRLGRLVDEDESAGEESR